MADFEVVHRRRLADARTNLEQRRGDVWNIIVEEPLRFDLPMSETAFFITVTIGGDGKLHPANDASLKIIQDWKERHKDTPNKSFEFPKGITVPVSAAGES